MNYYWTVIVLIVVQTVSGHYYSVTPLRETNTIHPQKCRINEWKESGPMKTTVIACEEVERTAKRYTRNGNLHSQSYDDCNWTVCDFPGSDNCYTTFVYCGPLVIRSADQLPEL